jgi:hypothetical protein
VTNGIPLGCPLLLPVGTVNGVQTLKASTIEIVVERWAPPPAGSGGGGSDEGEEDFARGGYNVSAALKRLGKLARWGDAHHAILTEPPLKLARSSVFRDDLALECFQR